MTEKARWSLYRTVEVRDSADNVVMVYYRPTLVVERG